MAQKRGIGQISGGAKMHRPGAAKKRKRVSGKAKVVLQRQGELKSIEKYQGPTRCPLVSGTPFQTDLFFASTGTGDANRIGRRMCLKTLQMNWNIKLGTGTDATQMVRLLIVRQIQPSGTSIALSDVLDRTSDDHQALESAYDLDNSTDYRVLYDRLVHLNPNGVGSVSGKFYMKCKLDQLYNNSTGSITTLKSNNIRVFAFSNVASTDEPLITFCARARFTDS